MYVSHLSLVDFRCYENVDVELVEGVNAFVGPNGQGKTNLVEAIGYVATLGSHRVASDAPLIRFGAHRAMIRTRIIRGDRASTAELEITQGKANRARLNRAAPTRARDVLGLLHVVVFAPEDLVLVKGDPDARRSFLDSLMVQLSPRLAGVAADYDKVLRQRSALLKSAKMTRRSTHGRGSSSSGELPGANAGGDLRTLDVWDLKLAELGAQIIDFRRRAILALSPYVASAYEHVSSGQGTAEIVYRSSLEQHLEPDEAAAMAENTSIALLEAQILDALMRLRSREIERGVCLVGPHRDDVGLSIGGLPAKGYASHGESWSLALALRLGSYDLLTSGPMESAGANLDVNRDLAPLGDDAEPVLVLDDVFAELDVRRRDRLAERVAQAKQVLITAAVGGDVPESLGGVRFDVLGGAVSRVP